MQDTPNAGDVRSEQLSAMGSPVQGVRGALHVPNLSGCLFICGLPEVACQKPSVGSFQGCLQLEGSGGTALCMVYNRSLHGRLTN